MTVMISPNPDKQLADVIAVRAAQILLNHGSHVLMREELQARCNLTELQAVNIINGFHIPDYVRIAEVIAAKEAEEHEN